MVETVFGSIQCVKKQISYYIGIGKDAVPAGSTILVC
jgi:hypothetical protein